MLVRVVVVIHLFAVQAAAVAATSAWLSAALSAAGHSLKGSPERSTASR